MMRTRTRGEITPLVEHFKETRANGTVSTEYDIEGKSLLWNGESETTTDVVTPRFRTRLDRGEIINNPFKSWKLSCSPGFSGYQAVRSAATGTQLKYSEGLYLYGDVPGAPYLPVIDLEEFFSEICTEVAARVATTNVDGAIETAEGRQTMKMFDLRQYNLRRQIDREILHARKRGKTYSPSVPATVLANNWLMYRYGIGPLLGLLEGSIVEGTKIQTRRETARSGTSTGGSSVSTHTVTGGLATVVYEITRTWQSSLRAGILYEYRNWRNPYGLSLDQLPLALWNTVPWSFVVDWFWNTQRYVGAIVPRAGIHRLATWYGYHNQIDINVRVKSATVTSSGWAWSKPPSGSTTIRAEGRRRIPGLLAPSLAFREGAMQDMKNVKRIGDALALSYQMLRRLLSHT